jgi:hypothetical protein
LIRKSDDHAVIKAGPGQDFDVICSINNGDYVYTTGNSKTVAGVTWLELEGGGWINAARLE